MLQLGLTMSMAQFMGAVPAGAAETVTLSGFSRDRTIFDGDIANGTDAAVVPVAGATDAADGTVIEARAVSLDDGGATTTPWTPVATAAGGAWQGTLTTPVSTSWYRAEARVQGGGARALAANRFGVGLVWAIENQSNVNRGINGTDLLAPDSFSPLGNAEGDFQIVWSNGGAPVGPFAVHDAALSHTTAGRPEPLTASVAAMARTFATLAPGIKVMAGFMTQSGSAVGDLLRDDDGTPRQWRDDVTNPQGTGVVDILTADGSEIGMFHFTHGRDLNDDAGLIAVVFGTDQDGAVLPGIDQDAPFPDWQATGAGAGYLTSDEINHVFTQALPGLKTGRTKWLYATATAAEALQGVSPTDHLSRMNPPDLSPYLAARAAVAPPVVYGLIKTGADRTHFSEIDTRGMPERYRALAFHVSAAAAPGQTGLIAPASPVFDSIVWHPDHVEIASSFGPITTRAVIDNGAPLDPAAFFPADPATPGTAGPTEVLGFFHGDGSPAIARLQDGKLRILPASGQSFDGLSRLYYAAGDAKKLAISVTAGQPGAWDEAQFTDHLPVIVHPDWTWSHYGGRIAPPFADSEALNIANDLTASEAFFAVNGGPIFQSTANLSVLLSDTTAFTVDARIQRTTGKPFYVFVLDKATASFSNIETRRILFDSSGNLLLRLIEKGTNATLLNVTVPVADLGASDDAVHSWRIAIDTAGGSYAISRDGVQVASGATDAVTTPAVGYKRGTPLSFFWGKNTAGSVVHARFHEGYTPSGPLGAPLLAVAAQIDPPGVVLTGVTQK